MWFTYQDSDKLDKFTAKSRQRSHSEIRKEGILWYVALHLFDDDTNDPVVLYLILESIKWIYKSKRGLKSQVEPHIYAKGETTQWSKQRNAEAHIYAVLENIYEYN